MRSLTTFLAFAALGGAFYAADSATRPTAGTAAEPANATAIGLARLIRERAGLDVTGIVTAPATDGARDFRGLLRADGRLRPVYGRVAIRCPSGADRPACWEIAHLEIDGTPAGALHPAALTVERAPEAEAEIETADIAPAKSAPAAPIEAKAATVIAPSQPPAASGPMPTHAVDRPIVNARSGPGTENEVVARLPEGLRLAMIEEQDGWGRFVVLDGDGKGQEIWAALRILKAVP